MKGVCEIILSEQGKEILHTKDTNMATNAVANLMNPPANFFMQGDTDYRSVLTSKTPIGKKLLGGVLLFGNQITEDVNTIYPPSDNPQIGYAGDDAYAGLNAYRGSYNQIESQVLSNGYKHVWTFSEPQANGTIRCVSLTSPQGGKGGWNANADVVNSFIANGTMDLTQVASTMKNFSTIMGLIGNYTKDIFTGISVSDKTVTFTDYKLSAIAGLTDNLTTSATTVTAKTSTLPLQSDAKGWFASNTFCVSAKGSGTTLYYVKFNGTDKAMTELTITVTGANFNSENNFFCSYAELDGYLYILDGTNMTKVWKINLANTADITFITLPKPMAGLCASKFQNGIVFILPSTANAYFYSNGTFTILGVPIYASSYMSKIIPSNFISAPYTLFCSSYYNDNSSNCISIIAPYLGTIDNLASPVTKTANQTMKVIYTVTNS